MAKEYEISKVTERCRRCGRELAPGEEIVATVRESGEEFVRQDFCPACWDGEDSPRGGDVLGVWRSAVPRPDQKKKLFVDDELLVNFFERLEGADDPAKVNFRFVLALVLMRKKLLHYERAEPREDGTELWKMRFRGSDQTVDVTNPNMDEEKIAQVSEHLGEILRGEL